MPLSNINGKPKFTMIEANTPAGPIGQAQPELLLHPNGCPSPPFSVKEPGTPPFVTDKQPRQECYSN